MNRPSINLKRELRRLLSAALEEMDSEQITKLRIEKGTSLTFGWTLFWRIPADLRAKWCNVAYGLESLTDTHVETLLVDWVKSNLVWTISRKEAEENGLLH